MCNRIGGIGGRVDDPTASSANRSNRCGPEVGFYLRSSSPQRNDVRSLEIQHRAANALTVAKSLYVGDMRHNAS